MKTIVTLSALQHYAVCPRQCALIYIEQVWAENFLTAQGRVLHERVDSGEPELRKGIKFERNVHVFSENLGVTGILDLVEYDIRSGGLKPIEYKRGRPKSTRCDEIQLCAQALCLEEMNKTIITEGALWYAQIRHRVPVLFSGSLRQETLKTIEDVRSLLDNESTPSPQYCKQCLACSLKEWCQPKLFSNDKSKSYTYSLFNNK